METLFINKIASFIKRHNLLTPKSKYLVALSGGADSVALLLALNELGYNVEACHCNFHLRGEESDRDELFCTNLCAQLGIPLHRIHFDTKSYAEVHKESIEMAARNLRYQYFKQLKKDIEASGVCVAHHQDDSVETVLINLIRGTGIKGLTGISPKNRDILRPLLCIEKEDILKYLKGRGQDYVTDSTNFVDDIVRNKIRLNIIPLLKDINPAACQNIAKTAHYLDEANKVLESSNIMEEALFIDDYGCDGPVAKDDLGFIYIDKDWVKEQASQEFVLYSALNPFGFTGNQTEEMLNSFDKIGKTWESPTHQLVIDRENFVIRDKSKMTTFIPKTFPETGCYLLPPRSVLAEWPIKKFNTDEECEEYWRSEQKIRITSMERDLDFTASKEDYTITVDAEKIQFPLMLRLTQAGDSFHPFGMKGNKLVSDYLTDKKVNLFMKESQLVLVDATDNIIWLVGKRTSEDYKIQPSTKHILQVEIL